jgi:hypothetical protein
VLLQADREVSNAYQAYGTPSAVLVSHDGRIASHVAQGAAQIAALTSSSANGAIALARASLVQGSPAPDLALSGMRGERIRISSFLGRRLLLLFWNPSCGFCAQMLERLRAWERSDARGAISLLLVSSGSVEANLGMALSSTIALDDGFVVGRAFGAGGTPSALIIDEAGRIASPLLSGPTRYLRFLAKRRRGQPWKKSPPQHDARAGQGAQYMEPSDFDALSRDFAGGISRRVILRILAGALFTGLATSLSRIRHVQAAFSCFTQGVLGCQLIADQNFEKELADCDEVPHPSPCMSAARARHLQALEACDHCPQNTHCNANFLLSDKPNRLYGQLSWGMLPRRTRLL